MHLYGITYYRCKPSLPLLSSILYPPTLWLQFPLVDELARDQMKKNIPKLSVGDTVKVGLTVNEGKGKTRTQRLNGTIIADDGANTNRTVRFQTEITFVALSTVSFFLQVTFRRIFQGIGVEMVMPVHAPAVQSFEVVRHGRVRRAKLYYLRERKGKAAKVSEYDRYSRAVMARPVNVVCKHIFIGSTVLLSNAIRLN